MLNSLEKYGCSSVQPVSEDDDEDPPRYMPVGCRANQAWCGATPIYPLTDLKPDEQWVCIHIDLSF